MMHSENCDIVTLCSVLALDHVDFGQMMITGFGIITPHGDQQGVVTLILFGVQCGVCHICHNYHTCHTCHIYYIYHI